MGFKRVNTLEAQPGVCYFCGSGTKADYLDTGTSIDYYGAFVICHECLFAFAKVFGFLSPDEVNHLVEENKRLVDENIDLEIQRSALAEACQNLAIANFGHNELMVVHDNPSYSSEFSIPSSVSSDTDDVLEDSELPDEQSSGSTRELDEGEKHSSESSDDKGMEFLHSSSSGSGEFSFNI